LNFAHVSHRVDKPNADKDDNRPNHQHQDVGATAAIFILIVVFGLLTFAHDE
jgi:hypothetical protein